MNTDIVIIGAGPAGIFTAMELLRRGSKEKILLLEKGRSIETRRTAILQQAFPARARFRTASCPSARRLAATCLS